MAETTLVWIEVIPRNRVSTVVQIFLIGVPEYQSQPSEQENDWSAPQATQGDSAHVEPNDSHEHVATKPLGPLEVLLV
jgi:hypothetical protein